MNGPHLQTPEHDAAWLLIPWYVNGRIDESERACVDAHLHTCAACRQELAVQRQLCRTLAASHPEVEQLPTASFKRLLQKIDAGENGHDISRPAAGTQHGATWYGSRGIAASLALIVLTVAGIATFIRIKPIADKTPATYYTVTSPTPRVPSEVIRAVFSPTVTVADLQRILDDAKLHIVAGPTTAGVYSLAKTGTQSVNESLQRLRQHSEVVFAEPTAANGATVVTQ